MRVLVRHSQKCLQINPKPFHQIVFSRFFYYWLNDLLTCVLTYLLTYWCLQTSITGEQLGLETWFFTNQCRFVLRCAFSPTVATTVLATFIPFCVPILSLQRRKVTICDRHIMASLWDIKIAEPFLILCLAYNAIERVRHRWNWCVMAFTYWSISRVYSPYFPQWLDGLQRCFLCCSLLTLLYNGQNIAEYEAYWLMDV